MLSVVITPAKGPAELGALLAQLIPAAVDGLVRDVLLAGAAEGVALELCEEAGVVVVADRAAAAGVAKSDWLLVLPQDFSLPPDWVARVLGCIEKGGGSVPERRRRWLEVRSRHARVLKRASAGESS